MPGSRWLEPVLRDIAYAAKSLRRRPMFTATAVLSLAFGIAATTSVFSVIDALDVRPLPFQEPDRLVWLAEVTPPGHEVCSSCPFLTSEATVRDWTAQTMSFDGIGAVRSTEWSWVHDDVTEREPARQATPGFFRLLGVAPLLGRGFVGSDTTVGAAPVAVLAYDFWRTRLGGDRSIVGRQLPAMAGQTPITVVGVLPAGFRFRADVALWFPLSMKAESRRTSRSLVAVGRIKPGGSVQRASAELGAISNRLAMTYPKPYQGWGARAEPLRTLLNAAAGKSRFLLFGLTLLVLAIAVLNVGGLLVGRMLARQSEFAMRTALGASRGVLVRQLLAEGLCLGGVGGVLAIAITAWAVRYAPMWLSAESIGLAVRVDRRVLAFGLVVATVVGVLAAVPPAYRAASMDLAGALRRAVVADGRRERASSDALIVFQIAFALMNLTAAGVVTRDFIALRYTDLGYDPMRLFSTSVSASGINARHPVTWRATAEAARTRIAAMPGVTAVTLEYVNAEHPAIVRSLDGPRAPDTDVTVVKGVGDSYFATFGTPPLHGRIFRSSDGPGAPGIAVVNSAAAHVYWPGRNPIGKRLFLGDSGAAGEIVTVVGVVADAERGELVSRHWPMVYRPIDQARLYHAAGKLYVRVASDRPEVLRRAEAAIREATGDRVAPFASELRRVDERVASRRFSAGVLDLFAAFGLLLAAAGTYAVVAYSVARRTREVGIRMAVGATSRSITMLMARRGMGLAICGTLLGVAASFLLVRAASSLTTATSAANPWTLLTAGCVMFGVTVLATLVPAVGAARTDVVNVLTRLDT